MTSNLNGMSIKPAIAVDTIGDKTHGSNISAKDPTTMGPGVDHGDLARTGILVSPGNQNIFPGGIDSGAALLMAKGLGQNGQFILGLMNSIRNGNAESGASGGQDLMGNLISGLIDEYKTSINIPPQIQEREERGVKVRAIKEKGQQHNLGLLDGLPNHGALIGMSGYRTPEVKKVPTAKQHNDQMMTQNMFGQLQGEIMSLAQMFQGLQKNGAGGGQGGASAAQGGGLNNGPSYWDDIHTTLTPNMSTALNSLSTLIQGHETDNGVGYVTGGVVHYGIYLENAAQLLSYVENIEDLMIVLSRLQWDTSIMGREALDNVVIQIENAWGVALQEADYNGTITVTYANANAQMEFANSMSNTIYASGAVSYANTGNTSPGTPGGGTGGGGSGGGGSGGGGSGGGGGGQNMLGQIFGKSVKTIQDMWKRLAPTGEKTATQMHKKLTQQQEAQKQKQVNDATLKNQGDPFSVFTQSQ